MMRRKNDGVPRCGFSDNLFRTLQRKFGRDMGLTTLGGAFEEDGLLEIRQAMPVGKLFYSFHFLSPQNQRGLKPNGNLTGIA